MQTQPSVGQSLKTRFGVGLNHETIDLGDALELLVFGDNMAGKQRVKETAFYLTVNPGRARLIQYAQVEILSFARRTCSRTAVCTGIPFITESRWVR